MKAENLEKHYLGDIKKENDPEFGDIMVIKKTTTRESEVKTQILNLQRRLKMKHENLIQLKSIKKEIQSSWCSKNYLVLAKYEYIKNNLQKEYNKRSNNKNYFHPLQILRFLYDGIDVFSFLEENNIKHNEINPNLLFLYKDEIEGYLRLKICERLNGANDFRINNFTAINMNLDIFMAPKDFNYLSRGSKKYKRDSFKEDVFCLGLIFLQMGVLENVQIVYNFLKGNFLEEKLFVLKKRFNKVYEKNTLLQSIIDKMLQIDENKRPSFIELKEALPNWDEVINISKNVSSNPYINISKNNIVNGSNFHKNDQNNFKEENYFKSQKINSEVINQKLDFSNFNNKNLKNFVPDYQNSNLNNQSIKRHLESSYPIYNNDKNKDEKNSEINELSDIFLSSNFKNRKIKNEIPQDSYLDKEMKKEEENFFMINKNSGKNKIYIPIQKTKSLLKNDLNEKNSNYYQNPFKKIPKIALPPFCKHKKKRDISHDISEERIKNPVNYKINLLETQNSQYEKNPANSWKNNSEMITNNKNKVNIKNSQNFSPNITPNLSRNLSPNLSFNKKNKIVSNQNFEKKNEKRNYISTANSLELNNNLRLKYKNNQNFKFENKINKNNNDKKSENPSTLILSHETLKLNSFNNKKLPFIPESVKNKKYKQENVFNFKKDSLTFQKRNSLRQVSNIDTYFQKKSCSTKTKSILNLKNVNDNSQFKSNYNQINVDQLKFTPKNIMQFHNHPDSQKINNQDFNHNIKNQNNPYVNFTSNIISQNDDYQNSNNYNQKQQSYINHHNSNEQNINLENLNYQKNNFNDNNQEVYYNQQQTKYKNNHSYQKVQVSQIQKNQDIYEDPNYKEIKNNENFNYEQNYQNNQNFHQIPKDNENNNDIKVLMLNNQKNKQIHLENQNIYYEENYQNIQNFQKIPLDNENGQNIQPVILNHQNNQKNHPENQNIYYQQNHNPLNNENIYNNTNNQQQTLSALNNKNPEYQPQMGNVNNLKTNFENNHQDIDFLNEQNKIQNMIDLNQQKNYVNFKYNHSEVQNENIESKEKFQSLSMDEKLDINKIPEEIKNIKNMPISGQNNSNNNFEIKFNIENQNDDNNNLKNININNNNLPNFNKNNFQNVNSNKLLNDNKTNLQNLKKNNLLNVNNNNLKKINNNNIQNNNQDVKNINLENIHNHVDINEDEREVIEDEKKIVIRYNNTKDDEDIFKKNNIPKIFESENGQVYKSVAEEKFEYNEEGEYIRRIYVKYVNLTKEEMELYKNQNKIVEKINKDKLNLENKSKSISSENDKEFRNQDKKKNRNIPTFENFEENNDNKDLSNVKTHLQENILSKRNEQIFNTTNFFDTSNNNSMLKKSFESQNKILDYFKNESNYFSDQNKNNSPVQNNHEKFSNNNEILQKKYNNFQENVQNNQFYKNENNQLYQNENNQFYQNENNLNENNQFCQNENNKFYQNENQNNNSIEKKQFYHKENQNFSNPNKELLKKENKNIFSKNNNNFENEFISKKNLNYRYDMNLDIDSKNNNKIDLLKTSEVSNPYLVTNSNKNTLSGFLKDYKENEDFYNKKLNVK